MTRPSRVIVALLVVLVSCTGEDGRQQPSVEPPPRTRVSDRAIRIACSLPRAQLVRTWNGYRPDRSANLQIVANPPNYFGNHLHSGPWPYLQRVPLLLYGPGHITPVGPVTTPATMVDVAPTFAELLRFELPQRDGRPIPDVLEESAEPPRLIVSVIWDGVGRNVLDEWPDSWPTVRGLIDQGAWLENFTVGSSPSVTPAIHTTLGTGAYPRKHGIMDLMFTRGGRFVDSRLAPRFLLLPTLGDLYDRARGNRPIIGSMSEQMMLGMLGRGTLMEGADEDIALSPKGASFALPGPNGELFRFPDYAAEVPGLEEAVHRLDLQDGRADRIWMDTSLDESSSVSLTPAFAEWQTRVVEELIRREGFGADDVPDLLYVNYKQVDKIGHRFSMNSPQAEAAVAAVDRGLGELVEALDREVGEGEWVLALTADHGSSPDVSVTGAYNIDMAELTGDLQRRFDPDGDENDLVLNHRVTQLWLDEGELAEHGSTLDDVTAFLMRYRAEDNAPDAAALGPADPQRPVFDAVFPSAAFRRLPCLEGAT